jgi:ABC-type transporter Mla subunit MlaD
MKRRLSDYLVALAIIACSAVLCGALVYAFSGWGKGTSGRTFAIDFPDVTGVRVHSEVRYAGAPAGAVIGVRLLTAAERARLPEEQRSNAVRVTVELLEDVPPIPADTKITLSSDTLLSEKFIAFSAGSATAPKLANGVTLQGSGSSGLDGVAEKIGLLVDSLDPLLKAVEKTLLQFDPLLAKTGDAVQTLKDGMAEALPRISKLADDLSTTATSADTALKRIDKLIVEAEGPIKTDLEKLKEALEQLKDTLGSADRFLTHTDKSLDARMAELGVVLENLKVATTYAKAAMRTLGEHPHRLIFGSKPNELPSEQEILRSQRAIPLKPKPTPRR